MKTTKQNEKELIMDLLETNKKLTIETIENTIALIDKLKYCENDEYDTIESLIKQGLYLIKFNITVN